MLLMCLVFFLQWLQFSRRYSSYGRQPKEAAKCSWKQAVRSQLKVGELVCLIVPGGHMCHTYKMASSLNRHWGGEAITALAIQHNGLLSPHHPSLSQSAPPTHTHTRARTHTHIHTYTKKSNTQVPTCMRKQIHVHIHAHSRPTQCDRSLIMPLILSDSCMYNGWFPGAMCRGIHPFIHLSHLLFIILLSHPPITSSTNISTQLLTYLLNQPPLSYFPFIPCSLSFFLSFFLPPPVIVWRI